MQSGLRTVAGVARISPGLRSVSSLVVKRPYGLVDSNFRTRRNVQTDATKAEATTVDQNTFSAVTTPPEALIPVDFTQNHVKTYSLSTPVLESIRSAMRSPPTVILPRINDAQLAKEVLAWRRRLDLRVCGHGEICAVAAEVMLALELNAKVQVEALAMINSFGVASNFRLMLDSNGEGEGGIVSEIQSVHCRTALGTRERRNSTPARSILLSSSRKTRQRRVGHRFVAPA